MEQTDRMYSMMKRIAPSVEILKQEVYDWIIFLRILATPVRYRFDKQVFQSFDLAAIHQKIQCLTKHDQLIIDIQTECGEYQLNIFKCTINEKSVLDGKIFKEYQELIEDYCDTKMIKNGIYGYIRSLDEQQYNNVERMSRRTFENADERDKLPKQYNKNKEVTIDCNQLAGYDSYYQGLCFTSCWKMYFSDNYFSIIPKAIFLEIQQVHAIQILSESIVKITLFKDPFKWNIKANRQCQRLFRDQLGFDQFIWVNGTGVLRPPFIEYGFSESCIQTIQYQNEFFQPTKKKKAVNFVTRNYDFLSKKNSVHRSKGRLNAKAYFPWVDEKNKQMMVYRSINPERAIDNGLSAYEFYIREFLESEILDKTYDDFLFVLRFYLPKETIKNIPLEQLWDCLSDINISNLQQKVYETAFDVEKGANDLRVIFLDKEQLKREGPVKK